MHRYTGYLLKAKSPCSLLDSGWSLFVVFVCFQAKKSKTVWVYYIFQATFTDTYIFLVISPFTNCKNISNTATRLWKNYLFNKTECDLLGSKIRTPLI